VLFRSVGSFHDDAMQAFRQACPAVATSMPPGEARAFTIAALLGVSRFVRTPAVALQIPEKAGAITLASPRVLAASHRRGVMVQIWTVNERVDMDRLLDLGVDGVITDFVEELNAAVQERQQSRDAAGE